MKKAIFGGLALAIAAAACADTAGSDLLAKSVKAMNDAALLKADCTVQVVGGAPSAVSVQLGKPNLARVDTATKLVVADGTTITTYDKTNNSFYKEPKTTQKLMKSLNEAGMGIWASFFNVGAIAGAQDPRILPTVTRKGMSLTPVQFSKQTSQQLTFTYFLGADALPRQVEIDTKSQKGNDTTIVAASAITVGASADPSLFAFKAPAGSRELSAAEIGADKWYTNFNEAVAVAKASNRLVLVDFYTGWCYWCKVLRAEVFPKDEFKAMSKYFVFCEIDAEAEVALASRFSVDAYPTSVFVNGDGNLVHKLVGYKPLKDYVAEMDDARKAAGL